jgi:hypothetical protein
VRGDPLHNRSFILPTRRTEHGRPALAAKGENCFHVPIITPSIIYRI